MDRWSREGVIFRVNILNRRYRILRMRILPQTLDEQKVRLWMAKIEGELNYVMTVLRQYENTSGLIKIAKKAISS